MIGGTNMRRRINVAMAAVFALTMWGGISVEAAHDENLNVYTLNAVVVTADRTKNKFGDTITEQSYYRTGGDVKVITREEIEKRHYNDLTEAIKRIPGVTFSNAGYRGGQYGYNAYNNSMAINGDSRVIVTIDGRRVDNAVSGRFGSSNSDNLSQTMVDLNQLLNIESVDKIEVIKGPGASAYGADATGGVINIITRKGAGDPNTTVDLSTGSWGHHIYNFTYSGKTKDDHPTSYFISVGRDMGGDLQYHDGITKENHVYEGTWHKDNSIDVRFDKTFDNNRNLKVWFNHKDTISGYPITARYWQYWNEKDWNRIIERTLLPDGFGNTDNPGYRNLFSLDALAGSYNSSKHNDLDVTYTFHKDKDMESFVRFYNQSHNYWGVDHYPNWTSDEEMKGWEKFEYDKEIYDDDGNPVIDPATGKVKIVKSTAWILPFPETELGRKHLQKYIEAKKDEITDSEWEQNQGFQVQVAKSFGIHDIIASLTYDYSVMEQYNDYGWKAEAVRYNRSTWMGYVQDKIHVTDKWDVTPALRYSRYSGIGGVKRVLKDKNGKVIKEDLYGESSLLTPSVSMQYAFDSDFSGYVGWTNVYRPIKGNDYKTDAYNGGKLEDEKGNVYTFGLRKKLGNDTELGVHYDLTAMSNVVVSHLIHHPTDPNKRMLKYLNAKQDKKSFNVTLDHRFNEHWTMGLSYSKLTDEYKAKGKIKLADDPAKDLNLYRPANHYALNLSYQNGAFYSGVLMNWYTGMNTNAFTKNQFFVVDWNANYEVNKDMSLYVTVNNLTNEAYENAYSDYNGLGAAPQPGRSVMVGTKYKF